MSRLLAFCAPILSFATAVLFFGGWLLGGIVWVWSLVIAWSVSGFGGTFATAVLPPFAQLYWAVRVGRAVDWTAPYCMAVWLLLAVGGLKFLLAGILGFAVEYRSRPAPQKAPRTPAGFDFEDDEIVLSTSLIGDHRAEFTQGAEMLTMPQLRHQIARLAREKGDTEFADAIIYGALSDDEVFRELERRYGPYPPHAN